MKKYLRKIFMLILVIVCVFNLCGCNKNIKINISSPSNITSQVETEKYNVKNEIDYDTLVEFDNIKMEVEKEINIGDKVQYGVMAYDDGGRNYLSPMMDWIVLDKDDKNALLITNKIILASSYIDEESGVDYDSSLLNSVCEGAYPYIFSDFEREGIISINDKKIFAPTKEIYEKYFGKMDIDGTNKNAISIASKAAKNKKLDISTNNDFGYFGAGSYWLSDEVGNDKAMWVGEYGHLYEEGDDKNNLHGVRFCMYVDLNHLVYEKNIVFGNYEQDNNIDNGKEKIEWKILEINNNKVILMSKNILFCSVYDKKYEERDFYYRNSQLRKNLVNVFYNKAFNDLEQKIICDHKYNLPKKFDISMAYQDDRQECEEFFDKVFIIDKNEYDRYYDCEEPYAPPENCRFETNITPYALSCPNKEYYPDDLLSGYIYENKKTFYWFRDLYWGMLGGDYQILGTARNGDNDFIAPRLNFRYGVRPFIEIDIDVLNKIINENEQNINVEKVENVGNQELLSTNADVNNGFKSSDDIILGNKYINTFANINELLEGKYNLCLDPYYYDVNEEKKEISVKVYSDSNDYEGILTFEYELDDEGFIVNEKLVEQIDICDVNGIVKNNDVNKKITLRDYELTLLRLFNTNTIPKYEKLPINNNLLNKINEQLKSIFDDNFSYSIKSNIIDRDNKANVLYGLDDIIPNEGDNELEIDIISKDVVSRYKIITNVKYVDEKSYYIDDINIIFDKSFNKPGDIDKPKMFLDTKNFDKKIKLSEVMQQKKTSDIKQKSFITYKELVDEKINDNKGSLLKSTLYSLNPVKKGQNSNDNYYFEFSLDNIKFDIVKFGRYKNKLIEWYVLSDENNQKLLISKYILDNKKYSENNICSSWENCTLREWLNNDFYNEVFTDDEKEKINEVNINCKYPNDNEVFVKDKVFLMDGDEYEKFFGGFTNSHVNSYGMAEATNYAKNVKNNGKKLFVEDKPDSYYEYTKGFSYYWLRDFYDDDYVENVSPKGQLLSEKFYEIEKSGVRPCILIGNKLKNDDIDYVDINNENDDDNNEDEKNYKRFLTIGGKDLYIDVYTNIFTFENNTKINFGRLNEDSHFDFMLSEIDDIFKDRYYFDEKQEKLYFIDWTEKFIEGGYPDSKVYNSLVMIDNNLNKTKLAEKIYEFIAFNDSLIYVYRNKNDVFLYKNNEEKQLNIGKHNYFLFGHQGDNYCYAKERTFNSNNVYKIQDGNVIPIAELPKEYR